MSYRKVMVVDDTDVDRYIAERVVKKFQFADEIISMEAAQDALEYLTSNSEAREMLPQIIFLDIRMPGLDGFDFLERFEKLPEPVRQKIIIIMLSSSLNKDDYDKAMNNPY